MWASFREGEIAPFQSRGRSQHPGKTKKAAAAAAAKTKGEGGWKREGAVWVVMVTSCNPSPRHLWNSLDYQWIFVQWELCLGGTFFSEDIKEWWCFHQWLCPSPGPRERNSASFQVTKIFITRDRLCKSWQPFRGHELSFSCLLLWMVLLLAVILPPPIAGNW